MGVRGLTTYIANHHKKYLKKYQLHSCYVIIDGNSLACQLFVRFASRAHCAFGGDYDRYAQNLREFFKLLAKCDVKAIVVFDGGYEPRKVNTTISRMSERIAAMKHVKPCSQDSAMIFPLFLRIVFKQILKEMNIPFVQCDFEADQEIAALAYKYNCPVLSYDSDFYIFDVNYIPIPLIEFEASPLSFDIGQSPQKYCINCKMYKIDFFLESFGGLDKTMLPLLASLLGNDYVRISAFRKFYSQFNLSKGNGNPLQKKIARVIEWLRNETFESAIERILGRIKVIKHRSVTRNIKNVVNAYTNLNVTIESYLPPEFSNGVVVKKPNEIKLRDCSMLDAATNSNNEDDVDVEMKETESEETEDSDGSLSEDENEKDRFDELADKNDLKNNDEMDVEILDQLKNIKKSASKVTERLPPWLLDYARRGLIEPCIIDILTLRTYFALPQIEDSFSRTSHFTCVTLIKIICKLLAGNYSQEISLWTKNENNKVQRFLLHFLDTPKMTELGLVPTFTVDQKKLLLFQCLNIPSEFCLDSFPDEWKLYICAIIFWIKNTSEPAVTECHLISLCMSMVALSVIDSKVGFFRKKIHFLKRYGKLKKRIIKRIEFGFSDCDIIDNEFDGEDNSNKETFLSNEGEISNESLGSIKQIVSSVSPEDCIAVYEEFYSFHQLDENLKVNKSLFSLQDIHLFAQFQSSLYHIMLINSLFAFPLQEPKISSLYSGTFIYNLSIALRNFESTAAKYLESLLKYSPTILNLINTMCSEIAEIAPVVVEQRVIKKTRRRKRRRTAKSNENEADVGDEMVPPSDTENSGFYDANNAFSLLSV